MQDSPNFLTNPGVKFIPEHLRPETSIPTPISEQPDHSKKKRLGCLSLFLVFVALLVVASPLLYGGARATRGALLAKSSLELMRTQLEDRNFNDALLSIEDAEIGLGEIRAGLKATGPWRFFPYIGSRLRALQDVEGVGSTAIAGAKELISVAKTMTSVLEGEGILDPSKAIGASRSFKDLSKEEKRSILAELQKSLPAMQRAKERIDIAMDAWDRIPKDQLFVPARIALEPVMKQFPIIRKQIDDAVSLTEILLPLVGYPEGRTYLVLLQNADELRPGGGFIGNIGEVTVDAADFEKIDFKDIYAIDGPVNDTWKEVAPESIQKNLHVPARSEERRVGKECRSRWSPYH